MNFSGISYIDILYNKNKLRLTTIGMDYAKTKGIEILLRLYKHNQIKKNCLISKPLVKDMAYDIIKLTDYRNIQKLRTIHPDADLDGYLNLHSRGPFKANEILSKLIIENAIQFKAPSNYVQVFYHIT